MALTNTLILTRIGVAPAANCNAIIDNFSSEGLAGLQNVTDEEVRDVCASHAKRQDGPFPILLTPILKQRMKALILCVKDLVQVGQPIGFVDTVNQAEL